MKSSTNSSLQLKNTIRLFESLRLLQETNDWMASVHLGHKVIGLLDGLIKDFSKKGKYQKTVLEATIAEKCPNFKKSIKEWDALSKKITTQSKELDYVEIKALTNQLGSDLAIISRQISFLESDPNQVTQNINKKFFRNSKNVLTAGISLILGLLILVSLAIFRNTHKGLKAEYFSDPDLTNIEVTRYEKNINYDWGNDPPTWGFSADYFSIRWTGLLKIMEGGEYEFITRSDDGVRLWINDQLIIDNWSTHSATVDRKKISLHKGKVPIKLEYYDNTAFASIQLKWITPDNPDETVIAPQYFSVDKR